MVEWIVFYALAIYYTYVVRTVWKTIKPEYQPPIRRHPDLFDDPGEPFPFQTPENPWRIRSMNDLSPQAIRMLQAWGQERERRQNQRRLTEPKVNWKKEGF